MHNQFISSDHTAKNSGTGVEVMLGCHKSSHQDMVLLRGGNLSLKYHHNLQKEEIEHLGSKAQTFKIQRHLNIFLFDVQKCWAPIAPLQLKALFDGR